MATRVLIVDDHELLAQSLVFALRADGFDARTGHERDLGGIVAQVEAFDPDVVLLDLDLGGELGSSLPLVGRLRHDDRRVVMLTAITDRLQLAECIAAGAAGIVAKSEPFDALLRAVSDAAASGSLLSPAEREDLLAELRRHRSSQKVCLEPFGRLTPREQQVLAGLMEGKAAAQIATESVVSLATVRSQIRSLLRKLDVNSQLAAVALARRAGWSIDGTHHRPSLAHPDPARSRRLAPLSWER